MTKLIKYLLWKLELVDLVWFHNKLRIIRTDSDNGKQYIHNPYFGENGLDYYINIDEWSDGNKPYDLKDLKEFNGSVLSTYKFIKTKNIKAQILMGQMDREDLRNKQQSEKTSYISSNVLQGTVYNQVPQTGLVWSLNSPILAPPQVTYSITNTTDDAEHGTGNV